MAKVALKRLSAPRLGLFERLVAFVRVNPSTPLPMKNYVPYALAALCLTGALAPEASAQIGRRFPSEKKVVPDPVTGVPLTFLTSTPSGDSKIYQTHHQWTSDGKWLIFRSNRVQGQAMAVNEETGDIVQVTEGGYSGMLCLADNSMNLYFARQPGMVLADASNAPATGGAMVAANAPAGAAAAPAGGGRGGRSTIPSQIVRVDLAKLFADSAAGKLKAASEYEHVLGTVPLEYGNVGDVALDPTEDFVYFRITNKEEAAKYLPADKTPEKSFGPRGMGAGPTGLASMNLKTGAVKPIIAVPFQIGHVQTNPWVPGEIVFCWETGGKAPQRTWTVKSDGTGLRPLYPEAEYEWITHEAVITKDEVAIAILAHRNIGGVDRPRPVTETAAAAPSPAQGAANAARRPQADPTATWGRSGTGEYPSGLGIVNLRTREMRIVGQVPMGDAGRSVWHVHGSPDGRWAVADDFQYRLWLIDRKSGETTLLADLGHKVRARDHIHPTFSADSTRIEIQTAMLSGDAKPGEQLQLNICVVPVPKAFLARTYSEKLPQ